jgi:hypothetical protein
MCTSMYTYVALFSLERKRLSMVLTLLAGGYGGAASRVGISEPDSLCLEIEILNVAGPWEPKEPGVYDWTLAMLRFLIGRFPERDPQK